MVGDQFGKSCPDELMEVPDIVMLLFFFEYS